MKLLNSDDQFPDNPRRPEPDPKNEEPFGLPAPRPLPAKKPLPASTVVAEPIPSPEPQAPAPQPAGPGPQRSSGQGVPARFRRFTQTGQTQAKAEVAAAAPSEARPDGQAGGPGERLRAAEQAGRHAKPLKLPLRYRLRPSKQKTRYAFWDIAAAISLLVNAVLLGTVVVMALQIRNLKVKEAVSSGLLGGLYNSFVSMDQASIQTTITVNAQIPLNFSLPVQQNTSVVLTGKTTIPGAYVTISSALLNISAPATVTLPAGTNLPIALNMDIPVQTSIPVSLQVPVNIPLAATGLHQPFVDLQKSIQPYYCLLDPNAQTNQGIYICHQNP